MIRPHTQSGLTTRYHLNGTIETATVRRQGHIYEGEGHGWRKTETVEQFYTTLDAFLRQYVVFA